MHRGQLLAMAPCIGACVDAFLGPLNAAMDRFGIDTAAREAAFLAQAIHESAGLSRRSGNLNYSPGLLMAFNTWKVTRFTPNMATELGRTVHLISAKSWNSSSKK